MKYRPAALAFALFTLAIIASNWLINHFGLVHLPGTSWAAPAGSFAAAITFPLRDVVQRFGGRWLGILAILVGAGVSYLVSPTLALASGGTYLISESLDFLVYTPLQRRYFASAVLASGLVAATVDSLIFLKWAGIPYSLALPGLLLAKLVVQPLGGLSAYGLRRKLPSVAFA